MKKKLLKYFYLVILTFIGNIVFANSNEDFSANSFSKTISSDEEFHLQELEKLVVFYKQTDANYETHHDKIEIVFLIPVNGILHKRKLFLKKNLH
jgi:hypothetical protein